MITIIEGMRKQTPADGMILTFDGQFSKEVYLGNGMSEWDEVLDNGQMDPIEPEIVN